MSKRIEDECCGCAVPAYPCMGSACPNRNVVRYYCDCCDDEFEPEELFVYDDTDEELCIDCLMKKFKTVKEMRR
jgi:hypothetical protein